VTPKQHPREQCISPVHVVVDTVAAHTVPWSSAPVRRRPLYFRGSVGVRNGN
jgi:hypothetical protein